MAKRVDLSAQILSYSVAVSINTLYALGHLPDEVSATAEFIEKFDQLFNAFNSTYLTSSQKKTKQKCTQWQQWPHLIPEQLSPISVKGENKGKCCSSCIVGWQISITSLIALWKDLQNSGFKYLLKNWLNQNCLENLFWILRSKGEFKDNPDPQQFRATLRHAIIDKHFVFSTSANCALNADKILLDISNVTIQQKKTKETPQNTAAIELVTMAMPPLSIPKKNVVTYMAGYLIKQYPVDDCAACNQVFKLQNLSETSPVSHYELLRFKTYREQIVWLSSNWHRNWCIQALILPTLFKH